MTSILPISFSSSLEITEKATIFLLFPDFLEKSTRMEKFRKDLPLLPLDDRYGVSYDSVALRNSFNRSIRRS